MMTNLPGKPSVSVLWLLMATYPRAIAMSKQDHLPLPSSSRQHALAVPDDDGDEQLQRALALSQDEARAPKRARREETPEEERRELER
jgi:tyrosyl-DNA phosphodiesterase-1